MLPGNYWNNGEFKDQLDPKTYRYTTLSEMFARDMAAPKTKEYVSPDGSLFLPAARTFQQGPPDGTGWRFSDNLDTYGFVTAKPGSRVYVSNESEGRTYSGLVNADGTRHRPQAVRRPRRRKRGGGGRTAMSISPMARCWSTRRTANRSARSMCRSGRCRSCSAARTGGPCSS